jgi:excisionase family DNA binding protein
MTSGAECEELLTPAECAALWKVDPKTITRWAKAGKLTSIRTLGGHRRYRKHEVMALLSPVPEAPADPLKAPVRTLWPAAHADASGRLIAHIQGKGVATVGNLTAESADDLADLGLRPAQIDEVRLRLALKGLTLRGEVLGRVACA